MSQTSESLVQWFYTNAPAAWITALVAIVTCIFVLWTRKRPKRIVVRQTAGSSLVRVWPSVRGKIKLTFEDRLITSLGQVDAILFNDGSDVIQRPAVTIALPKDAVILATLLTPRSLQASSKIEGSRVTISMPYLNPFRDHSQMIQVSILIDGDIEPIKVIGAGESWSARFQPQLAGSQAARTLIIVVGLIVGIMITNVFYGRYVELKWGIPSSEISLRAFGAAIPVLLPVVGLLAFVVRLANKISTGLKPRDIGVVDGDDA